MKIESDLGLRRRRQAAQPTDLVDRVSGPLSHLYIVSCLNFTMTNSFANISLALAKSCTMVNIE